MSQNVIITHVIMIVNQKMGSKNRDFAKYKKSTDFFSILVPDLKSAWKII